MCSGLRPTENQSANDLTNRSSVDLYALHNSATIDGDPNGSDSLETSTSKIYNVLSHWNSYTSLVIVAGFSPTTQPQVISNVDKPLLSGQIDLVHNSATIPDAEIIQEDSSLRFLNDTDFGSFIDLLADLRETMNNFNDLRVRQRGTDLDLERPFIRQNRIPPRRVWRRQRAIVD